jgi:hypothetical protein
MKAKIIFYSQKEIPPNKRTAFKKKLAGHNDSSHGRKYKYRINGLLDSIEYIKPCHAALIVKNKEIRKLISLMKKYSISNKIYNIDVPDKDFKI